MKTRTLPNKKLLLIGAFVAAIVFPYTAGAVTSTGSNQNVTFSIDKAIEIVNPASGIGSIGTTAPVVGSSSFTRELTGTGNITGGHRSNASVTATVQKVSSTISTDIQVKDSASAFQTIGSGVNVKSNDSSLRSTSNNLMSAISADFKQGISWADAAGDQTVVIRTVLTN